MVDNGETCDGDCPVGCDDGNFCTADILTGSAESCSAACSNTPITECSFEADGCCAPGCNVGNDIDCNTECGNGVLEFDEICDGDCPVTCDDNNACTLDDFTGSPDTCDAVCTHVPNVACISDDGCCPDGCEFALDSDCLNPCGNGIVDPGELCDGNCPTTCDDGSACTIDGLVGDPLTCNAQCVSLPITTCEAGDGCCANGCDATTDDDCSASCGNGTIEPGELCDGNCPDSCDDANVCTLDTLIGSADNCSAEPTKISVVHALLSSQVVGQSPSQVSPNSMFPLPQVSEQSLSVEESQPPGQQPSSL